jgi:hypothetical protein
MEKHFLNSFREKHVPFLRREHVLNYTSGREREIDREPACIGGRELACIGGREGERENQRV